jgi:hypothetical protein
MPALKMLIVSKSICVELSVYEIPLGYLSSSEWDQLRMTLVLKKICDGNRVRALFVALVKSRGESWCDVYELPGCAGCS